MKDSGDRARGISAALASALFLGVLPVLGKQAILSGFTPFAVVAIRSFLAVTFLFLYMRIFGVSLYMYPVGLIGCMFAGLMNGIGSVFYYLALARLDAGIGHLLYSFYPLFLAGWLLLDRQPISRVTLFRLALAIPGAFLLLRTTTAGVDLTGAIFMLVSAAFYALHLLINQRVLFEAPAPTVTFYTLLSMSATVTIAYFLFDHTQPPAQAAWFSLVAMALITFLSRLTLFMGIKKLGGMQTAILGLGEIIVTLLLSFTLLHEKFSMLQWFGAALIGASLVLVGFDHYTPEKRAHTGIFAWLNAPRITPLNLPWQK